MPEKLRPVRKSRLIGFTHKRTRKNGSAKFMFSSNFKTFLSLQYLSESKCIFAIRKPGNVKIEPTIKKYKHFINLCVALKNMFVTNDSTNDCNEEK